MTEIKDKYSRLLEIFDNLELSDIHDRRYAYKPLYDYFNKLILEVGVGLCNLDQISLQISHIKTRWKNIRYCLEYIKNPIVWDQTINQLNNIRSGVEHNDEYDPKQKQLLELRDNAPKFKDWIIRIAGEYYKISNNFTFKEGFYHLSNRHIDDAKLILHEYGEAPPYAAKLDYPLEFEKYPYQQIKEIVLKIEERLKSIAELEDIKRSDLDNLIKIVEIISHFRGKEEILLGNSICPKCGGKIDETQKYFGGGTEYQPEPEGVYILIGCLDCDYYIDSDTIYI